VTINPQRLLRFNSHTYQMLGKPDAVRLYFSEKRDMIGVEVSSPRLNDAFPVMPTGTGFRVNAAPFLRHFNICVDRTLKFVNPEISGRELFLNLGEVISVAIKKRKK